jgi:acyl-CoA-binding protein
MRTIYTEKDIQFAAWMTSRWLYESENMVISAISRPVQKSPFVLQPPATAFTLPMNMDSLFDRAVSIVQSLPKTGPIQTDYEEKLGMYRCANHTTFREWSSDATSSACISKVVQDILLSLQELTRNSKATVGNVTSARPGMWDMLGRAKWQAHLVCIW